MDASQDEVSRLLQALRRNEGELGDLVPLVYDELRSLARRRIERERPDHTLQATALVHEAWLRLAEDRNLAWQSRRHFFAAAAEAMRRVLVDHARRVKSAKRGGGQERVTLSIDGLPGMDDPDRVLALDEALGTLAGEDPRAAEVARLRLFSGLSPEEAANALDVSVRTAAREWAFARARLTELMAGGV